MAKTEQQAKKTSGIVVIAGGGTGGHIYPGVAIARAVEARYPKLKVHFVGAQGGLEEKIVPREGFPLHTVPVGKLHKSAGLKVRIKTLLTLPLAFITAVRLLFQLKPVAVLGVGGFASGPMLFASSLFRYRSLIWEPNAYPGLANRLLARGVDECLLVFDEAGQHLHARKKTRAGLPVRSTMIPAPKTDSRIERPFRILVFGGSQGARFINFLIAEAIQENGGWLKNIELVHQTGPHDFQKIKDTYDGAPDRIQVFDYLHDMDKRYQWADLVICRAGASTVAEICACEKAAIFIPLPSAADDHQRKNAEVLANAQAAMLFPQKDASGATLSPDKIRSVIKSLRDDRSRLKTFEENIKRFQFPQAAEMIAERLVSRD